MRVGVAYDASTGDRIWHDGSARDNAIPAAFWKDAVEQTNRPFVTVGDGVLKARYNTAAYGYLCEVNDPCKLHTRGSRGIKVSHMLGL